MEGLHGFPDAVFYQLHFIDGPADGDIVTAFHPYFKMITPEGYIYEAKEPHDALEEYIQWLDDGTRKIDLYFKGKENPINFG